MHVGSVIQSLGSIATGAAPIPLELSRTVVVARGDVWRRTPQTRRGHVTLCLLHLGLTTIESVQR